ncbi:MAG TPA: hypothetical protein VJ436_06510, partial [Anaerolineales bacterium]|nr:hypothetical protein [Anaerolineales bacterium]
MARKKRGDKTPDELPVTPVDASSSGDPEAGVGARPSDWENGGGPELMSGEENPGMRAVEPVFEEPEAGMLSVGLGEQEPEEEGGMGAVDPVLPGDDLAEIPGLPVAEMEKPEALTSMRGAPFFTTTALLAPSPFMGEEGALAPVQAEERPARDEMVVLLISDEMMKAMWERADRAKISID